jgi:hypothetical protein
MYESVLFSRDKKHQFVMLSLVLLLLGAGPTLWLYCGGWVCVFFTHPPLVKHKEELIVKF